MFTPEKPLPPPPSAVKSRNESLGATLPTYRNRPSAADLSFSSVRSAFESMNKPDVRASISNLVKNPLVQRTAAAAAKNEQVRSAVISAAQNESFRNMAIKTAFNEPSYTSNKSNVEDIARQFESKPIMGGGAPQSLASTQRPFNSSNLDSLYRGSSNSSTAQRLLTNSSIYPSLSAQDPFDFPPQLPPSTPPTRNSFVDRTDKPFWSSSLDPTHPFQTKPKKQPPSRPPPPKLASQSNPNLVSLAPPSPDPITNEPYATVKYPYKAANHDELSAEPNDTVLLKREVDDQWIFGMNTRTGQLGIVPMSFLHVKVPLVPTSKMGGLSLSTSDYSNFGQNRCVGKALYDYDTGVEGDLKFKCGDLITIVGKANEDWLKGELYGKRGIFPLNYVNVSGNLSQFPLGEDSNDKPMSINERNKSFFGEEQQPRTVTAAFDYSSNVNEDLQFSVGDLIEVVDEPGNGWLLGKLKGKTGLVPLTYVLQQK